MTEYFEERVCSAVEAKLDEIVGDDGVTYWFTPHVERFVEITRQVLNPRYNADADETSIIALAPFGLELVEATSSQHDIRIVIDFLLACRHDGSIEPYNATTPSVWTLQNRLWGDFKQKLLGSPDDLQLDGLVDNMDILNVTLDAREVYIAGWAIVIGQIVPYAKLDSVAIDVGV